MIYGQSAPPLRRSNARFERPLFAEPSAPRTGPCFFSAVSARQRKGTVFSCSTRLSVSRTGTLYSGKGAQSSPRASIALRITNDLYTDERASRIKSDFLSSSARAAKASRGDTRAPCIIDRVCLFNFSLPSDCASGEGRRGRAGISRALGRAQKNETNDPTAPFHHIPRIISCPGFFSARPRRRRRRDETGQIRASGSIRLCSSATNNASH